MKTLQNGRTHSATHTHTNLTKFAKIKFLEKRLCFINTKEWEELEVDGEITDLRPILELDPEPNPEVYELLPKSSFDFKKDMEGMMNDINDLKPEEKE